MATDKSDLREAVRRLAGSRRPQGHPAPEKLAEYHARELPAEEIPELQDHLAECPECSQLLLDLESFEELEPPAGHRPVTDAQVRRDWKRLRRRLRSRDGHSRSARSGDRGSGDRRAGDGAAGDPGSDEEPELPPHRARFRRPGPLLAAAAVIVVAGTGIWAVGPHLWPSPSLTVNVPPVELHPVGTATTRGGAATAPARDLFSTGAYLLLGGAPSATSDGYEVLIRNAATGAVRLRSADLRPFAAGYFSLVIEPGVLPAGDYRIEVRSIGSDPEFSQEYELTVAEPGADS